MAWRPQHLVRSGELDNTTLGWTIGWLERLMAGEKPPFTWRKCLYMEWYSNTIAEFIDNEVDTLSWCSLLPEASRLLR